jgi:hypothetical protein
MVRRAAARAGVIARRNVHAAAERDGEVDRHDEMSAGFIGHLHGLFRSAGRNHPGLASLVVADAFVGELTRGSFKTIPAPTKLKIHGHIREVYG